MMTSNRAEKATEKKVIRLPKPDAENITVLTRELPNAPILPWQRYDSPWMKEGDDPTPADVVHLRDSPSGLDADSHVDAELLIDDRVVDIPESDQTPPSADELTDESVNDTGDLDHTDQTAIEIDEDASTFSPSSKSALPIDDTSTAC
jgi:hypothetical protein